ncbi:MAG: HepT-like ribonuclease domain-containing protein [Pseudomonadota bacterium]|nr:HepT-like ribonuclease domain-containing protein [Pseudomonadota bacterium]
MHADDRVRVLHMIDAGEAALQFIAGRSRADLDDDRMLLFASVRAVEVIGEAASKISEDARSANKHLPWTAIVGMRNRLVHGYFDIDTDIVWRTVTEEIPDLLSRLREIVE